MARLSELREKIFDSFWTGINLHIVIEIRQVLKLWVELINIEDSIFDTIVGGDVLEWRLFDKNSATAAVNCTDGYSNSRHWDWFWRFTNYIHSFLILMRIYLSPLWRFILILLNLDSFWLRFYVTKKLFFGWPYY